MTDAVTVDERVDGDTVSVRRLFDDAGGCEKFAQRILSFGPGRSHQRVEADADEVLYVLDGAATATVAGGEQPLARGTAVFVSKDTPWSIEAERELDILSVLVFAPAPVPDGTYAVVDLAEEERQTATAARQFSLGADPAAGCLSVTQFIGFIPPGRAPDHFHLYDEVLYVLEGQGLVHIDGEEAPLAPGSCVHLPAKLVHCLENVGADEMRILGVFRPAGSPAEAYYPDGTPAVYTAAA
ncbi:MAG: hypothetical protein QOJ22_1157 [Thermoleophilaceae bacterium]|nr:hypothetical protein [Thermoleophilaceae bacterium]